MGSEEVSSAPREQIPVALALSLEAPQPQTKADVGSIEELANTAQFRGMDAVRVLPFGVKRAVKADDESVGVPRVLPAITSSQDSQAYDGTYYHSGLIKNNRAHLYSNAEMALPRGTASVLVYGQAPSVPAGSELLSKQLNGSLVESGWENPSEMRDADVLKFSPDPIYSGTLPSAAKSIADILSAIVLDASYTQVYYYYRNGVWQTAQTIVRWDDASLGSSFLKGCFDDFSGGGRQITGAGKNVENLIASLYRLMQSYESFDDTPFYHTVEGVEYKAVLTNGGEDTFTWSHLYNGLRDAILDAIHFQQTAGNISIATGGNVTFQNPSLSQYPTQLGLPAGCAVLRWTGAQFIAVAEGLEGIAPMDRFCFMPSLYYFVNSTLRTSPDEEIYREYTSEVSDWSILLNKYQLGTEVTRSTRAVALDSPLQYACSMFVADITASSRYLPDADGDGATSCDASGTHFPVTGVIIGGQFRQNFDFSADTSPGNAEYFLYDSQISGVYLTTTESADFRTLVLPTPPGEDIYFFLELRNDSGAPFYGAEGIVMAGSYFYLAGKLEMPSSGEHPSVFTQDHYTAVKCTVKSLENAHVAIPDLGEAQLTMGVQCETSWQMAASSFVVLD